MLLAVVGVSLMYFVLGDHSHGTGMEETRTSLMLDVENAAPEDVSHLKDERTQAQDRVFPQFIRMYLPSGLRGLVIAALFAAAMSTIDSGANSISTIMTVDFVRPLRRKPLTMQGELKLARILTASMGLIVVTTTIGLYHIAKGTNIIDLCQKGFNCFLGPLGALFVLAMFSRRATPATVIPAVLAGEAVGICGSYSSDLFAVAFSTHLVVPASWLATIVVSHALSLILQVRADSESSKWMWKPVVAGNTE